MSYALGINTGPLPEAGVLLPDSPQALGTFGVSAPFVAVVASIVLGARTPEIS
jgi:hypothetical protein